MKVLVVDDEKDVQNLFEQRFRKEIRNGEVELVFAFFCTIKRRLYENKNLSKRQ